MIFIALCLFITISLENIYNFYFIHLRSNSRQQLNSQPFGLWSKSCSPTFHFHLSFINASILLLSIIIIYGWEKLFPIHNNYLPPIKLITVNNNCLPLIEIFTANKITVNNSYLPLIRLFTLNSYYIRLMEKITVNNYYLSLMNVKNIIENY